MTPDRLQQIEELYHFAREASSDERAALLGQADPELRREVESLLARQADRLILDRPILFHVDPAIPGLNPGVRLGPYQVESKIGQGGMGEIFRAIDTRLGRPVAIKFVHERFSARFDREARAISSLNHPNICTLYDIGPNYLVMELLEGDTLAARLKNGPLPVDEALRYASQIAAALVHAHEHGIVHRDLKPGNIMLSRSGIKVLDFGIATLKGDDTLNGSRVVMGTPAYMAPEQREGNPADARSDLYSFGWVVYEMLTGVRPTSDRKPVPSKTLGKVVSRCLEGEPARRWQSAVELVSALEATRHAGKSGIRMVAAAAVVVALIASFIIGGYFVLRPAPRLTTKDTIVLADFVNSTGDPIFDGTLRQGLAIQLEQSPFLKIMDDQQVQGVLRLMSLPPGSRITNPIAHQICIREGAAATIDGAIARLGTNYVITLQAIACPDGKTLARELIQAVDKENVLNAVGSAAAAIRGKLGESHNSIQKLNLPLEKATTPSLEALQSYTAGYSEMGQGNFLAALPLFKRAIEIDPNFAMAYYFLGEALYNAGDTHGQGYLKQALRLSGRVSEYERDLIAGEYYSQVTGELDKAVDALKLGIRIYPRSVVFHNVLSVIYIDLGQYEEGLMEGLEAAWLQARDEPSNRGLLDAYMCLDRLPEAKELRDKLRGQALGGPRVHQRFLELAYIDDNQAAVDREIQWFAGKPEEYLSLGLQAANRNLHGQRRESHKLYLRAAETALRHELRNVAAEFEEADARADALSGICQSVHRLGRPALALAICGDATQAEKLAAKTSKLFPKATIWNAVQLPEIRAAIALNRGQPAKSVDLLASAVPYERASPEAVYLRGLAYLRQIKGAEAATEFQKIVGHKGASWASDWHHSNQGQFYSLSYLGMARGSALAGDTENARSSFQAFFELWKDADADLPILQQAKAEYAKLLPR